jgi:DNA topoisomerase-3
LGKTVFITEKPSVAQEYRKVLGLSGGTKGNGYIEGHSDYLGKDVIITWAVGHLVSICSPEEQNPDWGGKWTRDKLPMIPTTFKYKPLANTADQYKVVKSIYTRNDIDAIYYAGDSGREGIYIQALIRNQIFKKPPTGIEEKVVWIDSFTEEAIKKGIREAKPYSSYQPMIDSGYERAIADWLIGMNFTEGFSITCGKTLNVGRVMTPTLAMVVKRQEEIDNFVKTDYFGVKTDFGAAWKAVKGSKFFESDLLYNENGFLKEKDALALKSEFDADKALTVSDVKTQTKTEYAPYLFNLADLQNYCSKVFKISPAQTLSVAQSLYEKKFTTYPRTDSRFLTTAVAKDLKKRGYDVPSRYVDDSKVTDHYALMPTFEGNPSSLSGLEKSVYEAIFKRFEDILKPPYIYDSTAVTYKHKNGECLFESIKTVKQWGYRERGTDEEVSDKLVPVKGSTVNVKAFNINPMETKPPVAYTTGSLIMAMEKAGKLIEDEELREQIKTTGIGTSATRANIIDKLEKKEFITIDKKQKIEPTAYGKWCIPIIEKFDEKLISPEKTAQMEERLAEIADGKKSRADYEAFVKDYVAETTKRVLTENKERVEREPAVSFGACPKCGMAVTKGKFGAYCSGRCGMSINKIFGKELTDTQITKLLNGEKITFTANGYKTTVYPEVTSKDYNGKMYYNWKSSGEKVQNKGR